MRKYYLIIKATWDEYATYRLNFVMWRVRMVIRFLITYFLWTSVFSGTSSILGYQQSSLLSYIVVVYIISNFVFATRTGDIGSEINQGKLTNYLIRPINYFGYLLSRDVGDKVLNLAFSLVELTLIFAILKPPIEIIFTGQTLGIAGIAMIGSIGAYFLVSILLGFIGFWTPEVWAPRFIFFMVVEFLAGTFFPIDIFPDALEKVILATPFPYFFYFPTKIFLGQLSTAEITQGFWVLFAWVFGLYFLMQFVWHRGLKNYSAEGR